MWKRQRVSKSKVWKGDAAHCRSWLACPWDKSLEPNSSEHHHYAHSYHNRKHVGVGAWPTALLRASHGLSLPHQSSSGEEMLCSCLGYWWGNWSLREWENSMTRRSRCSFSTPHLLSFSNSPQHSIVAVSLQESYFSASLASRNGCELWIGLMCVCGFSEAFYRKQVQLKIILPISFLLAGMVIWWLDFKDSPCSESWPCLVRQDKTWKRSYCPWNSRSVCSASLQN